MSESGLSTATYLAWWGAILSTVLAGVKLWEVWRDRFRLTVDAYLSGDPSVGNKVRIRNLAGRPVTVTHWELLYGTGRWPRLNLEPMEFCDPDISGIRIEAYDTLELDFSEDRHFKWGHKYLSGRRIYINLHLADGRSVLRQVYPFA